MPVNYDVNLNMANEVPLSETTRRPSGAIGLFQTGEGQGGAGLAA